MKNKKTSINLADHGTFAQIPKALIFSKGLTQTEKAVACTILCYTPAFPSYQSLARGTGLSLSTIQRAISGLLNKNIFARVKGSSFKKKANVYTLNPINLWRTQGRNLGQKNNRIKAKAQAQQSAPTVMPPPQVQESQAPITAPIVSSVSTATNLETKAQEQAPITAPPVAIDYRAISEARFSSKPQVQIAAPPQVDINSAEFAAKCQAMNDQRAREKLLWAQIDAENAAEEAAKIAAANDSVSFDCTEPLDAEFIIANIAAEEAAEIAAALLAAEENELNQALLLEEEMK